MNFNTAIFLVNDRCRALTVSYEWCDKDGKDAAGRLVKIDIFKTLDPSIRKGDLVLGETQSRHKLCVYRVVDTDVEVDLEHSVYIPWVVGKVSSALDDLKRMEDDMQGAIRRKDKEKKRAELAETMLKDYGDELKKLAISNAGADPTLSPPQTPPSPPSPPFPPDRQDRAYEDNRPTRSYGDPGDVQF